MPTSCSHLCPHTRADRIWNIRNKGIWSLSNLQHRQRSKTPQGTFKLSKSHNAYNYFKIWFQCSYFCPGVFSYMPAQMDWMCSDSCMYSTRFLCIPDIFGIKIIFHWRGTMVHEPSVIKEKRQTISVLLLWYKDRKRQNLRPKLNLAHRMLRNSWKWS